MPELPEVETVVRGLQAKIPGKIVESVKVLDKKPLVNCIPLSFIAFMKGRRFLDVLRFGKYIHFLLDNGASLVGHLRMTGKYVFLDADCQPPSPVSNTHLRLIFYFTDGSRLIYKDMRRFGTLKVYEAGQEIEEKLRTGPDPFDKGVTGSWLVEKLSNRRQALKPVLLDQKLMSGLGNIYVCEALFMAGIDPFIPANQLDLKNAVKLLSKIRQLLRLAIKKNGTTISDFRSVDEKSGEFQAMLQVYGREGHSCRKCRSTSIMREKQVGRSTWFCPRCQGNYI